MLYGYNTCLITFSHLYYLDLGFCCSQIYVYINDQIFGYLVSSGTVTYLRLVISSDIIEELHCISMYVCISTSSCLIRGNDKKNKFKLKNNVHPIRLNKRCASLYYKKQLAACSCIFSAFLTLLEILIRFIVYFL